MEQTENRIAIKSFKKKIVPAFKEEIFLWLLKITNVKKNGIRAKWTVLKMLVIREIKMWAFLFFKKQYPSKYSHRDYVFYKIILA